MIKSTLNEFWFNILSQGELTIRYLVGIIGGLIGLLTPTVPFMLICTIAVLADSYTAWSLSKRAKDKHPDRIADGKFKSNPFGRVFTTLIKVYFATALAFCMDMYIFPMWNMYLPNIVAGAVCFWQVWSMLENESSCNDKKWAKVLQKIMVDKTERHFNIDLSILKDSNNGNERSAAGDSNLRNTEEY